MNQLTSSWPVKFKPATQTMREDLLKICENKSKKRKHNSSRLYNWLTEEADPLVEHKEVRLGSKRKVTLIYSPIPIPTVMQLLLDLAFLGDGLT